MGQAPHHCEGQFRKIVARVGGRPRWHPAGANQDFIDDHLLLSLAAVEMNNLFLIPSLDTGDLQLKRTKA